MKFIHTADLHIGKRVRGFSLIDEQKYALEQVASYAVQEKVHAVIIAGDVFDKPVAPLEALDVLEEFFATLATAHIPVVAIAGNHDSAERLSFGARFREERFVHIARAFSATPQFLDFTEANNDSKEENKEKVAPLRVRVHLIPFVRPVHVRAAFPHQAEAIANYTDALRVACANQPLIEKGANLLVAHQFVVHGESEPETCESETVSVGGLDSVQASVFDAFDYVALGHIHTAQSVGRDTIRYSGSIFPYSFSEAGREKSVTLIDISPSITGANTSPGATNKRLSVTTRSLPLHENRTLREITGSFEELARTSPSDPHADDYLHVTLTDDALMNAMEKIRALYPHVMQLDFAHTRRIQTARQQAIKDAHLSNDPIGLLTDFYRSQTENELSESQIAAIRTIIDEEVAAR